MPVDRTIADYIDAHLTPGLADTELQTQFEVIVRDIVLLLPTAAETAQHTAAYLSYVVSFQYMRSRNETEQAYFAKALSESFARLYNDNTLMRAIHAAPRAHLYSTLLSFYHLHHALIMNGLRSHAGPFFLDASDALRRLQHIVGAACGPWHAHIRLQGSNDYPARVMVHNGSPQIEIGRPEESGPTLSFAIATWNMQGASASTESKWRTRVLQLARANDIVVLQEAGSAPASATLSAQLQVNDQFGVAHQIDHYLWNLGTVARPEVYHVFFLDVQRLRVNLAIVVRGTSDLDIHDMVVVSDGVTVTAPVYRPALGIRVRRWSALHHEHVTVFNFHAISGGGANSSRVLREVSWHTETPFVMLGDFNRDPRPGTSRPHAGNWISPPDIARLELANGPTHPADQPQAMLDYAVSNGTATPTAPGIVGLPGPSNHSDVSYRFSF
ncbi:endonuclease/exonuclease/phosphatase family protein [Pseudomonas sp. 5P_5.1_Bac1]|uniref:endonuclease/exonuclease/phosphatase family protein n=1 Tax=Pseudomonas sp. 5P_5.1_Bac1 TaxID=2971616 RepID=UPI0021C74C2B|nr:endonuclease/exonuclease/phosphatase family protein [Pseudomonas sp. 5P_5.1_Bac1]MCU1720613.1 endonuclease/exonuclease/phosphatase family protein [Pseudomonas sp. 5P_5.1_Bac1]